MSCINQIVSLRLFTHFANDRFVRKTNNASFDFENYFKKVNNIPETNISCVNQIVSFMLFTYFMNVRFMRKTNNACNDFEKSL